MISTTSVKDTDVLQRSIRSDTDEGKHTDWEIDVFFDGDCPICLREIEMLRRRDRFHRIRFTNIASESFDERDHGVSMSELMAEIHARLPDGRWLRGVEVFRRLYAAVGFTWLVRMTRLPGVSQILDYGYRVFARNRLQLTGRCCPENGSCSIGN